MCLCQRWTTRRSMKTENAGLSMTMKKVNQLKWNGYFWSSFFLNGLEFPLKNRYLPFILCYHRDLIEKLEKWIAPNRCLSKEYDNMHIADGNHLSPDLLTIYSLAMVLPHIAKISGPAGQSARSAPVHPHTLSTLSTRCFYSFVYMEKRKKPQ